MKWPRDYWKGYNPDDPHEQRVNPELALLVAALLVFLLVAAVRWLIAN